MSAILVLFAAAMFAIVLHTLMSDTGLSNRQAIGLALAQALALVVAARLPSPAWAGSITAIVLASWWTETWWVDAMGNSYLLVLGMLALHAPVRSLLVYWVGTVVIAVLLAAALRPPAWLADLVEVTVLAALVLVAGAALRALAAAQSRLRAEQQAVRREQQRAALLEERTRIARELHDVVAHHMSVIAIQAEAAQYREPDTAPQTFAAIRDSAATAMGEMRRILGVLRSEDTGAAPQPSVPDIPALIESVRATGTPIELDMNGDFSATPAGIGLTMYRIVQEACSNAVRHAPGAPLTVRIHRDDSHIHLDLDNPATAGSGATPEAGHGLIGMRERAAACGGTLTADMIDSQFRVHASLPIEEPRP